MRLVILFAVLLLTACAPVGPEFIRPDVPANPAWLNAELEQFSSSAPELADWWKQLDDPALDRLIETALAQNNNLKIAGLRVLESQASLALARGSRYPQGQVVVGDATAVGASESSANTTAGDLDFTQFNVGASVSWEIDFWGRFRRGIEAADANLLASIASFDDAKLLLIAAVADTSIAVRSIEEPLQLADDRAAIQERSYEIVEVLFRNGESSELDALQARTLLLSTRATIPGLRISLQQAKNALSTLLGLPPSELTEFLASEGLLPTLPDNVAVGVPAELLRQRPDVRRAELQAYAQNALVGVANANLYPSFSLSGYFGVAAAGNTDTTRTGDSGIGELFRAESLTYSIGPSFVWPFLNYGRIRNDIRVQDARLQQALIQYRETVIQAAREVENSMTALARSKEQDLILEESVGVAARSSELSLLRYREGFADYQRVLDSQQALFSQQQRYAANRGTVISNFVAVFRSLGGGWQSELPRQFIDEATKQQMQERTNW
ncbi:MAG: efflux transporter outer membrane subunit, partial [Woeseiaceae bacterium]